MFQTRKPHREPAHEDAQHSSERPRYELAKQSYFDAEVTAFRRGERIHAPGLLLEPGDEVEYEGVPGHHMIPLNDAARAAAEKALPYVDPVERLPLIMESNEAQA